jgi:hypothetical protein
LKFQFARQVAHLPFIWFANILVPMQIAASKFFRPAAPAKRDFILGLLLTGMVNFNSESPAARADKSIKQMQPRGFWRVSANTGK